MEKEEYEFTIETTDTPLMDDSQTVDTDKKIFADNPDDPQASHFEVEEDNVTILDKPQELITAVGEGAAIAVGETAEFLEETGESIEDFFNVGRLVFRDNPDSLLPTIEYWNRDRVREAGLKDSIIGATEYLADAAEEAIPDTETSIGFFVEGMSQFATGFVLSRRLTGLKGVKGSFANSAIADATAFDPFEGNISNMINEDFPFLKNVFTEALAQDEDATAFKNRLRNAGEGFIIGGVFEGVTAAYKFSRGTKKAKEELVKNGEVSKETLESLDEAADEIEVMESNLKKEAEDFVKIKNGEDIPPPSSMPDTEVVKKERVAWRKKYDISRAKANTEIELEEQKSRSEGTARRNQFIAQQLIEEFENGLQRDGMKNVKISKEVNGKLEIDPTLARTVSKERLEKLTSVKQKSFRDVLFGVGENSLEISDAVNLSMSEGEMFSAVLKPEKFDALVSVASDLRNMSKSKGLGLWNDQNKVIDNLFNLTVEGEMIGGQELLDVLSKYGLSFEDYVMTVVGSGSEAGRTLNKLSQIRRSRPLSQQEALKQKKLLAEQGRIRDTIMRIENVRRGMMVSQLATASRNLLSGVIRAPMEGIGKLMDNALVAFEDGGIGAFGKAAISGENWRGSFRHLNLMFTTQKSAKAYTQLLMNQPELVDNLDRFYNQMGDLQARMGRGNAESTAGKVVDFAVSRGEDAAYYLNVPNRWQEFMLRNGMFLSDMERLVQRDWGIDLVETLNKGKVRDVMTDASSVRPEGSRSIIDIADEAMYNALDLTYANEPDIPLFRSLNTFIVRNGLTTVLPFPRFMFKSMELLAQYGAGSSIPVYRFMKKAITSRTNLPDFKKQIAEQRRIDISEVTDDMVTKERRAFSRKERDMIGKNMQGALLISAGIWYRGQEDAPADYTKMAMDDGNVLDTTPLFPLRPLLLIGEMVQQAKKNMLEKWVENNPNEIVEVLTGTNFRTGMSGYMLDDMVSTVFSGAEINATTVKRSGAALGNYFSTFLVPYAQLIDAARATGHMGNEYLDNAEEPTLDKSASFVDNFTRPFDQRYSFKEDLPTREFVMTEKAERKRIAARLFTGLNFFNADPEYADYLKRRGYNEFKLGAYSQSPQQKRIMNRNIREFLKSYVPHIKNEEEYMKGLWNTMPDKQKAGRTFDEYFDSTVLNQFEKDLNTFKSSMRESSAGELEEEAKVYIEFNRLPKKIRRRAIVLYETEIIKGKADMTDPTTVQQITQVGQNLR
tara:strand:+ start:2844 stop:6548 length:3705 start_codon:yes stop_codon:yes gene_type:complete